MNKGNDETMSLDDSKMFPDDVQETASGYFQQIYTQPQQTSLSVEQFLDILKRFHDSGNKKERDVFACVVKNLFEEYNFLEQYPDKELRTTASLLGGIVRENLITNVPLIYALRIVMESLTKESSSKLFTFGQVALSEFKARLKEYPRYCDKLLAIPLLQQRLEPTLYEYISCGAKGELPSIAAASTSVTSTTQFSQTPSESSK